MLENSKIYIRNYALISSVEDDLNQILRQTPSNLLSETNLHGLQKVTEPTEKVFDLTLGEKIEVIKSLMKRGAVNLSGASLTAINNIIPIRNRVYHARPLEYGDSEQTLQACIQLKRDSSNNFQNVEFALQALNKDEDGYLSNLVLHFDEEYNCEHNLPQADFYETGYIGRNTIRRELFRDLTHGAYPVVTIVGEGGLGKTALALRVAWDILEFKDNPFEVMIWVTAKRTRLSGFEIERLPTTHNSGLAAMESARVAFDAGSSGDIREALSELMGEFKCLLIIDNLETIIDDDIRWLATNVPMGSKVLFTSRVALGAADKPINLEALSKEDARSLFRAFAGLSRLKDDVSQPDAQLDKLIAKLNYSPLFIKWYIQARRSGKTRAEILSKKALIIDFCMESVFDDMSPDENNLLASMLCAQPPRTNQKMQFISELSGDHFEIAAQGLVRRNILRHTNVEGRVIYDISVLAKTYAAEKKFVGPTKAHDLRKKDRRYETEAGKAEAAARLSYRPTDVYLDKKDNFSARRHLESVIQLMREEDYDRAAIEIEQARKLSPEYFEVYRVQGALRHKQDDYVGAIDSFNSALDLSPDFAPLRYHFAQFLIETGDLERAEDQARTGLKIADQLSPPQLVFCLGRALTYQGKYVEAIDELQYLDAVDLNDWETTRLIDGKVDAICREIAARGEDDMWVDAFDRCKDLAKALSSVDVKFIDDRCRHKVSKQKYFIESACKSAGVSEGTQVLSVINGRLEKPKFEEKSDNDQTQLTGKVDKIQSDGRFGFIVGPTGRWFFHVNNLIIRSQFEELRKGDEVRFVLGRNHKGECADQVERLS